MPDDGADGGAAAAGGPSDAPPAAQPYPGDGGPEGAAPAAPPADIPAPAAGDPAPADPAAPAPADGPDGAPDGDPAEAGDDGADDAGDAGDAAGDDHKDVEAGGAPVAKAGGHGKLTALSAVYVVLVLGDLASDWIYYLDFPKKAGKNLDDYETSSLSFAIIESTLLFFTLIVGGFQSKSLPLHYSSLLGRAKVGKSETSEIADLRCLLGQFPVAAVDLMSDIAQLVIVVLVGLEVNDFDAWRTIFNLTMASLMILINLISLGIVVPRRKRLTELLLGLESGHDPRLAPPPKSEADPEEDAEEDEDDPADADAAPAEKAKPPSKKKAKIKEAEVEEEEEEEDEEEDEDEEEEPQPKKKKAKPPKKKKPKKRPKKKPIRPTPETPAAIAADAGPELILLSFEVPPANKHPVERHRIHVRRKTDNAFVRKFVISDKRGTSGRLVQHRIKSLDPETEYKVCISTANKAGWSSPSKWTTVQTKPEDAPGPRATAALFGKPGVPDISTKVMPTAIKIRWQFPENGGSEITKHHVQARSGRRVIKSVKLRSRPGQTRGSYVIQGLKPGHVYKLRVRCRNAKGWGRFCLPQDVTTAASTGGDGGDDDDDDDDIDLGNNSALAAFSHDADEALDEDPSASKTTAGATSVFDTREESATEIPLSESQSGDPVAMSSRADDHDEGVARPIAIKPPTAEAIAAFSDEEEEEEEEEAVGLPELPEPPKMSMSDQPMPMATIPAGDDDPELSAYMATHGDDVDELDLDEDLPAPVVVKEEDDKPAGASPDPLAIDSD